MEQTVALDLENPAWTFALDFYERPGVAEACLILQDQLDADIVELVIVLYAWSKLGMSLSENQGVELRAKMESWRETTVLPLRHIRRDLKPSRSDVPQVTREILRGHVKQAELLAEQIQIAWAEVWLTRGSTTNTSSDPLPVPKWLLVTPKDETMPESCNRAIAVIVQTALEVKQ